jgi:putative ABC transport system permease protein
MRRYTLLVALSAAVFAAGTSLAIGSQSMLLLDTRQVEKTDRLPAALLVAGQSVLDQRDGQLTDSMWDVVASRDWHHAG